MTLIEKVNKYNELNGELTKFFTERIKLLREAGKLFSDGKDTPHVHTYGDKITVKSITDVLISACPKPVRKIQVLFQVYNTSACLLLGDFQVTKSELEWDLIEFLTMSDNKLCYTPELEDLRHGFECLRLEPVAAINTTPDTPKQWTKYIWQWTDFNEVCFDESQLQNIMVEYLQAHHIRNEGWKQIIDIDEQKHLKRDAPVIYKDCIVFSRQIMGLSWCNLLLFFHFDKRLVGIRISEKNFIFQGIIPSINEFRSLTKKLLEII